MHGPLGWSTASLSYLTFRHNSFFFHPFQAHIELHLSTFWLCQTSTPVPKRHAVLSQPRPLQMSLHLPETPSSPLPLRVFPEGSAGKESACSAGETGDGDSIPGSGRSPGGGNGNPLQYSCLWIPWTEEPGGLQSSGLQRVGHDRLTKHVCSSPQPPPVSMCMWRTAAEHSGLHLATKFLATRSFPWAQYGLS